LFTILYKQGQGRISAWVRSKGSLNHGKLAAVCNVMPGETNKAKVVRYSKSSTTSLFNSITPDASTDTPFLKQSEKVAILSYSTFFTLQ
jgi:hypothetical protein